MFWDPGRQRNAADKTAAHDVWRVYGDMNNTGHMVNTKTHFNNLKMQIFRGNDPIGDVRWQALNLDDMAATATGSGTVGAIRDVIEIFDY